MSTLPRTLPPWVLLCFALGLYAPPWPNAHLARPWCVDHPGESGATLGLPWPLAPTGATTPGAPLPIPLASLCLCPVACPAWTPRPLPQRAASKHSRGRSWPPCACPRQGEALSGTDGKHEEGEVPLTPPLLECSVGTRYQKFRLYRFCLSGTHPAENTPRSFSPQKFYNQKSGREAVGIGAAGDGSGGPLAAWQDYPCP
jgi:hypothetical protein